MEKKWVKMKLQDYSESIVHNEYSGLSLLCLCW